MYKSIILPNFEAMCIKHASFVFKISQLCEIHKNGTLADPSFTVCKSC